MRIKERDKATAKILARELARLSPHLGGFGVRLVAKFLPTESHSETLILKGSAEEALERARSLLGKLGRIQPNDGAPSRTALRAVIGAGSLNLNPSVVDLEITAITPAECSAVITAAAKEGAVKQQTAAKAVRKVSEALSDFT